MNHNGIGAGALLDQLDNVLLELTVLCVAVLCAEQRYSGDGH